MVERADRIGRAAAYGAAAALVPYLVIKVSWVVGSLLGLLPVGRGFSLGGWLVLNTVTIGMAAAGIMLGLALVRPWGMRIPGRLVGFLAWVGAGFLVSILPFVAVSALVNSGTGSSQGSGGSAGDASMPGWEAVLLQCSFVGTGIALAVALPAYLRRRWPHALRRPERPRSRTSARSLWPAVTGAMTGLAWLYWAAGGTLGIAHRDERPAGWHVLAGVSACWALAASAAVLVLVRRRPTRLPYPLLLASAWLGSGSMFAWSGWRLPATLYVALAHPSDVSYPENVAVAVALHATAVLTGAGIMRTLARGARGPVSVPDRRAPVLPANDPSPGRVHPAPPSSSQL
ncbi:hypothetical protein [Streptomyces sp. NPDC004629]|uniref:hypothetical protein n=1 Tax=Streptomyces sp. NPDC004629 TaxID=3364705 RepID=UPI003692C4A0